MVQEYDISVVITTFNRSDMLPAALESVLERQCGETRYEVIVVDNNSTDRTRDVIEGFMARNGNLRCIFEPRQGVSHGRNAGIAHARAPIIAFFDDDIRVASNWIANIKRAFDEHPDIDFLGGKILPRWITSPPPWLTREHWWPLALLDYGDQPVYVTADNPLCLPTANASFRREVFERVGVFSPDFSRGEDHELLLRLWQVGSRGLYDPSVVVVAEVQPERLQERYHLRWNATTGRFNSLMHLNDIMDSDGRIIGERPDMIRFFGVPAFIYRSLVVETRKWISASLLGRKAASLRSRNAVWYLLGYISKRYEDTNPQPRLSTASEFAASVKALVLKKLGRGAR
jgi:glycosyltransferase involved in cell wall biosynthesis